MIVTMPVLARNMGIGVGFLVHCFVSDSGVEHGNIVQLRNKFSSSIERNVKLFSFEYAVSTVRFEIGQWLLHADESQRMTIQPSG